MACYSVLSSDKRRAPSVESSTRRDRCFVEGLCVIDASDRNKLREDVISPELVARNGMKIVACATHSYLFWRHGGESSRCCTTACSAVTRTEFLRVMQ